MPITISNADLEIAREPLTHPFGFKGGAFNEKWLCRVQLESEAGVRASGLGGLAILWSDAAVFRAHTETGGNLLMACMLERALLLARDMRFESPPDLLDQLIEPVHEYGKTITGNSGLRKTFTLNALVALDNAAWALYARALGTRDFDRVIPPSFRPALSHRHRVVACIPLISYAVSLDEVRKLVSQGFFVLKIKIGAPGDPKEMLAADMKRISDIHQAVGGAVTPHTEDGRVRYYLDANGRYENSEDLRRLLARAREIGMADRIILLEEPFAETRNLPVDDLGVRVAADESIHTVADVRRKLELGYSAFALKPAGKTLSMTLRMAAEAHRRGAPCFVADSACPPILVDWNKNVAARLAPLPGLATGLLESNGPQHYRNWQRMLREHPCHGAPWLSAANGVFDLGRDFYDAGGGIFSPPDQSDHAGHSHV